MFKITSTLLRLFLFSPFVHCAPTELKSTDSYNLVTGQQDATAHPGEIFYCGGLNEPTIATSKQQ